MFASLVLVSRSAALLPLFRFHTADFTLQISHCRFHTADFTLYVLSEMNWQTMHSFVSLRAIQCLDCAMALTCVCLCFTVPVSHGACVSLGSLR